MNDIGYNESKALAEAGAAIWDGMVKGIARTDTLITDAAHDAAVRAVANALSEMGQAEQRDGSVIAVDFDGTLCRDEWPDIGAPNMHLIKDLISRQIVDGCRVILWTCREGSLLDEAVGWCKAMGLRFDAVNANLPERIAEYGGDCRKVSADLYIDDKNIEMTHQFE